mmetsp:Transcript_8436/g.24145  ORF Transcript_8436/g.24145 Transcript_8436/m.24145 type:complete len:200 (-) Transcript_8436:68-667(-)
MRVFDPHAGVLLHLLDRPEGGALQLEGMELGRLHLGGTILQDALHSVVRQRPDIMDFLILLGLLLVEGRTQPPHLLLELAGADVELAGPRGGDAVSLVRLRFRLGQLGQLLLRRRCHTRQLLLALLDEFVQPAPVRLDTLVPLRDDLRQTLQLRLLLLLSLQADRDDLPLAGIQLVGKLADGEHPETPAPPRVSGRRCP